MTAEDVQSRIKLMLQTVRSFDDELRPARDKATKYFLGKPFGNEEDGRSKVVMTVLRDTVFSLYPALFRLFFNSSERTVEFTPRNPEGVEAAEQQTELCNHVFLRENNGLLLTNAVLEDAMVRRLGVVKWWWEDTPSVVITRYSDLTQDEMEGLAADPDVELAGAVSKDVIDPETGQPVASWSVEATRTIKDGRIRIEAIPREEFWYNKKARNKEHATICAHATYKTVSELRKMGIPDALLRESLSQGEERNESERVLRDPDSLGGTDGTLQFENQTLLYVESFPDMDVDGDGIAEIRKICTVGDAFRVASNEPASERPFGLLTPYPLAHRMEGLGVGDLTMDLQLLESSIARGILDSLGLSLFPRMEVVEGQVEMKDVLNTEIGGIIRAKQPGMVREVTHRFVGADAMPMFDWLDAKKEERTGRARGPDGLDQGAMQSTTPQGVQAAISASQDRLELFARVAAETFFKPLFLGIYRLAKQHQQKAKMLRMNGEWVPVDPRDWGDESPEVLVNVALGNGLIDRKLAVLTGIKQTQESYIQMFGPDNPMCGLAELNHTVTRALKLSGEPDVNRYFKKIDPAHPPQMPPPQPDPQIAIAQQGLQNDAAKTQIEAARAQSEHDMGQQTMQLDASERAAKMELEREKLQIMRDRVQRTLDLKEQQMAMQHEREVARMNMDAQLKREEMLLRAHTQDKVSERAADTGVAVAAIGHDATSVTASHALAGKLLDVTAQQEAADGAETSDSED